MSLKPDYPSLFPVEAVSRAISIVRGGTLQENLAELTHAGWVVLGYALSIAPGVPPTSIGSAEGAHSHVLTTESRAQLAELSAALESDDATDGNALRAADGLNADGLKGSQLTVFWHWTLKPLLIKLLQQILGGLS
jgi:hypothetical protein